MDDFRTEVDEHGNIKVMSYVEAVAISKEEQEQALRVFEQLQEENTKLREIAEAAWILFLKYGAVSPHELPKVDRVRESLNELGIKVSFEELGIEVEDA